MKFLQLGDQLIGIKRSLTRALARSVVFVLWSLFCRHTRSGFPPNIFASHTQSWNCRELPAPSLANACSYGLARCSPYGHVLLSSSGWLACLCIWSCPPRGTQPTEPSCKWQMTKDAFGGSRVIHGQNCPISDEISQKLDLYSDRPKRGRVYAGRASQSSTHGGRPRFFPAAQILHEVRSVNVFAHTHTLGQTRPVRMHTP